MQQHQCEYNATKETATAGSTSIGTKSVETIELTELVKNKTDARMANGIRFNRKTAWRISLSSSATIVESPIATPRLTIR